MQEQVMSGKFMANPVGQASFVNRDSSPVKLRFIRLSAVIVEEWIRNRRDQNNCDGKGDEQFHQNVLNSSRCEPLNSENNRSYCHGKIGKH
jgi:hypothetical protein